MAVERSRMLWDVERYESLVQAGLLTKDDRVELLDGEIIEMAPIGGRHQAVVDRLNRMLVRRLSDEVIVRVQGPVKLPPRSEPEPDVLLLRATDDFYESGHPGAIETILVIEVADSSLRFDREVKLPIYARSGIVEAWIVNLRHDTIEIHRSPTTDGYADVDVVERGGSVTPPAPADIAFSVDDILGR